MNPPNTHNLTPIQSVILSLTEAPEHTTPHKLRELILGLDLVVAEFGGGIRHRRAVSCSDDLLARELILTATPLAGVPESIHELLLTELENLIATHSPATCITYIGRRKLWATSPKDWCRLVGRLLQHVHTAEDRFTITAVVGEKFLETT